MPAEQVLWGVDLTTFDPAKAKGAGRAWRARLGLEDGRPVVLSPRQTRPHYHVDRIVRAFTDAGATCKVSSIHVNGWFGDFDKLSGFRRFHRDRWGTDVDVSRWAFFGDSQNDEPMFQAFPFSVGVRNVERFLDRLVYKPAWITDASGGDGFVEGVRAILAGRAAG